MYLRDDYLRHGNKAIRAVKDTVTRELSSDNNEKRLTS